MLSLSEIVAKLQDRRIDKVADAIEVHRNTIANIRSGKNANPEYRILAKLDAYLSE